MTTGTTPLLCLALLRRRKRQARAPHAHLSHDGAGRAGHRRVPPRAAARRHERAQGRFCGGLAALLKRLYRDWERRRKQDPKTPRATSPSTRRESLISRTFCASASRSSSPCRASRRSHSTGCATALRASPTARMCRCSASRRRWGTAQHP